MLILFSECDCERAVRKFESFRIQFEFVRNVSTELSQSKRPKDRSSRSTQVRRSRHSRSEEPTLRL